MMLRCHEVPFNLTLAWASCAAARFGTSDPLKDSIAHARHMMRSYLNQLCIAQNPFIFNKDPFVEQRPANEFDPFKLTVDGGLNRIANLTTQEGVFGRSRTHPSPKGAPEGCRL